MLSVIVLLYNNENYIENCLKSIISQGYKNIEIIVVNDGSTDNSLKIAKKIASTDSRIRIVDRENGGRSVARNTGITWLATCFMVLFLLIVFQIFLQIENKK